MVDTSNWRHFTREDFESLIEDRCIRKATLDDEQKLVVHWCVDLGKNKPTKHQNLFVHLYIYPYLSGDWIYTPDMPSYHALLEITGPLRPNCPEYLFKEETLEEISPPHTLERQIFMCGLYNKFSVLDGETIEIWSSDIREGEPREHYKFWGRAYIAMLEKHFGPLKPGDVVELPYLMRVEALEEAIDRGQFNKIEMLEDGSVELWCSEVKNGGPRQHINYPRSHPFHIQMIEKHLGPLKPGDIFELPEDMQ